MTGTSSGSTGTVPLPCAEGGCPSFGSPDIEDDIVGGHCVNVPDSSLPVYDVTVSGAGLPAAVDPWDAVDDTAAIQAWIDFVDDVGGAELRFAPGRYLLRIQCPEASLPANQLAGPLDVPAFQSEHCHALRLTSNLTIRGTAPGAVFALEPLQFRPDVDGNGLPCTADTPASCPVYPDGDGDGTPCDLDFDEECDLDGDGVVCRRDPDEPCASLDYLAMLAAVEAPPTLRDGFYQFDYKPISNTWVIGVEFEGDAMSWGGTVGTWLNPLVSRLDVGTNEEGDLRRVDWLMRGAIQVNAAGGGSNIGIAGCTFRGFAGSNVVAVARNVSDVCVLDNRVERTAGPAWIQSSGDFADHDASAFYLGGTGGRVVGNCLVASDELGALGARTAIEINEGDDYVVSRNTTIRHSKGFNLAPRMPQNLLPASPAGIRVVENCVREAANGVVVWNASGANSLQVPLSVEDNVVEIRYQEWRTARDRRCSGSGCENEKSFPMSGLSFNKNCTEPCAVKDAFGVVRVDGNEIRYEPGSGAYVAPIFQTKDDCRDHPDLCSDAIQVADWPGPIASLIVQGNVVEGALARGIHVQACADGSTTIADNEIVDAFATPDGALDGCGRKAGVVVGTDLSFSVCPLPTPPPLALVPPAAACEHSVEVTRNSVEDNGVPTVDTWLYSDLDVSDCRGADIGATQCTAPGPHVWRACTDPGPGGQPALLTDPVAWQVDPASFGCASTCLGPCP